MTSADTLTAPLAPPFPDDGPPLTLAVVTGSLTRRAGGLFHSVRGTARALASAGHRITVLGVADPSPAEMAEDLAAWAPLMPAAAPRRGPAGLAYAPALARHLDARFDVVHQHGLWQPHSRAVAQWRKRTGGGVVISPRGMLDPPALARSPLKKRLARLLYEDDNLAGADCLHALNEAEAEAIRRVGLTAPIAVIANGLAPETPAPLPPRPAGFPPERRILLFLGRLHPKKGLLPLLAAWARLGADVAATWHLVIAGWDEAGHATELREAITAHGLAGRAHLAGPLHGGEKRAALAHADAFVLPSTSEGLPMAVLEAWAAACPVLMTAACHMPHAFAVGAAVEIAPDPARMAAVLTQTLALPPTRLAAIGERGRALLRARHDADAVARAHVAVYRWIVAGGSTRGVAPPPMVRVG
ncbi:glycosyltransferase [Acuticoccus mangrovi]|uniref:Glycosyltransferase n=1 Tax=Acuticoccus mangrovi TaxID=2796142 RepID=A0A934IFX4_9HYPH|nr:glycosyltransferase [Acuticoccus mangrovi]MBJ3775924.1 glycosyltransferase [Acuticoccus mangrovi]